MIKLIKKKTFWETGSSCSFCEKSVKRIVRNKTGSIESLGQRKEK